MYFSVCKDITDELFFYKSHLRHFFYNKSNQRCHFPYKMLTTISFCFTSLDFSIICLVYSKSLSILFVHIITMNPSSTESYLLRYPTKILGINWLTLSQISYTIRLNSQCSVYLNNETVNKQLMASAFLDIKKVHLVNAIE